MKKEFIKYLPLDFVEYYNLIDNGDYQRLSSGYITGINVYGDIKVYDPILKELNIRAEVTKLLKRQIPFGNKSICNECSFGKYLSEGCSICDYRYKIITPGQRVFIEGFSCEVREFFITRQTSPRAVALSIPKPLDNSLKDGSVEGLNYVLEHQLDHKLHEYLMYTVWSKEIGNMTIESNILNNEKTPEIDLYPEIFIHKTPCEYCILNDSDICKQCYFYNYYDKRTY